MVKITAMMESDLETMSRKNLLALGIITIAGILLYFPLMLPLDSSERRRIENSTLAQSLQDESVRQLTVAAASILFPLFLDNALDFALQGQLVDSFERTMYLFYVCSSFLLQSIAFAISKSDVAIVYACSLCFQVWMVCCFAMASLNRYEPIYFPGWTATCMLCPMFAYLTCAVWYVTFGGSLMIITASEAIAAVFYLLPCIVYLSSMGALWWRSKLNAWRWMKSLPTLRKVAIAIVVFISTTLFTYTLRSSTWEDQVSLISFSPRFLRSYLALSIAFSTLIVIIPSRFAKLRTEKLKSELELKKTFVRYISHELRTPLSIVMNGLELVKENITNGSSADDSLELVHDLKDACSTGVEILNELLDYEKLESGLSKMDKSVQDPVPLIEATTAPFNMVTRLKGIELQLHNHIQERVLVDIDETKVRLHFSMILLLSLYSRSLKFCATFFRMPLNSLRPGGR